MKQTDLEKLLADMSLKEKVDQMLQLSGAFYLGDENSVLTGPANDMGIGKEDLEMAGSILGAAGADTMKKLQDDYMAKQPHHIPMLFMMDVIHGMKTIFPAPLAQGATFDPELSGECASAAAKEASAAGLHVTFSPMVDLVRDARWGRVVESTGEDPYLNSRFSEAIVKGFQGDDLKTPGKVASCIKHFAGYGGAVAGRDYNTVELSEHTFREFYLPAYKAGIDAGAAMVMTSFNTINGVPASTNKWLMRDILRGEMGFDGVLISDFAAILETVAHRSSKDAADAAKKALEAALAPLRGTIDQLPPMYSAVWVDGQRLYKLARAGKEVERPTRQVTIHRLDLLEFDPENRTCVIDVACSKGTYIRTLCHDIGEALGCGGMLTALRRTETLGFTTADCHTLEELKQASEEGRFEELLMPVDAAFRQYKSIFLSPKQTKMFLDGIRLDTNRIKIPAEGDTVRVYGDGRFLALAHIERMMETTSIMRRSRTGVGSHGNPKSSNSAP